MSTRGILAVVDADDILGVYHRFDSRPSNLGAHLLLEMLDSGGDLDSLVADWIRNAPYGWLYLPDRERVIDPGDDPPFWRKSDLDQQGWIEWVYVIDPKAREIRVFAGNPALRQWSSPPDHVLSVGPDGRCTPPIFTPSPWHVAALDWGWEDDSSIQRALRTQMVREIASVDRRGTLADQVEELIASRIDAAQWEAWTPGDAESRILERRGDGLRPAEDGTLRFYSPFYRTVGGAAWGSRVGPHRVGFPAPGLHAESGDFALLRADGASTRISLDLPEELAVPLLPAICTAVRGGVWAMESGDPNLYRFMRVVDDGQISDPSVEWELTRARELDPESMPGDELGASVPHPSIGAELLIWLRAKRIGGGVDI